MKWQIMGWLAVVLMAGSSLAQFGGGQSKNQPQLRELTGRVTDHSDAPVEQAIVYLKNSRTLVVKTFITGKDGAYRFPALAQNVDYDVYAERNGKKSETKTLSSFDSRVQARLNLKIDTGK